MHHRAGAVVHDGVVLVLACMCVAVVAGPVLLLAVEVAGAKVPAAWSLHDVATKGRHIAHLRRGGVTGGIGKGSIAFLDLGMICNLAQGRKRPKAQAILAGGDTAKAGDVADVDE